MSSNQSFRWENGHTTSILTTFLGMISLRELHPLSVDTVGGMQRRDIDIYLKYLFFNCYEDHLSSFGKNPFYELQVCYKYKDLIPA